MLFTPVGPVGGITVLEQPDMTVARLWGEIDEALRDQASSAFVRALDRGLPVVIETREVTFIDSTGIAFLIQFCRIGREEGLQVTLPDPPPLVSDVLTMLGLQEMFAGTASTPGTGRDATAPAVHCGADADADGRRRGDEVGDAPLVRG